MSIICKMNSATLVSMREELDKAHRFVVRKMRNGTITPKQAILALRKKYKAIAVKHGAI